MGHALFAQQLQIQLVPSDHHGYAISCFGARNGSIDAIITGGTPPYTYQWSNGSTSEDLTGLAAGYYSLAVIDGDSLRAMAEITLEQPLALRVGAEPYVYPNEHNISCHNCFNGSIDVSVLGGVAPYGYVWGDGPTTQNRTGLGALKYHVVVTDANGCSLRSETVVMTQPERDTWDRGGNIGTDPHTHYLGTADGADFVLKSNGEERLRLQANGEVMLWGGEPGRGTLYRDSTGVLKLLNIDPVPAEPCAREPLPFWTTTGNNLNTCEGCAGQFGSMDECPVNFVSHGTLRMQLGQGGGLMLGSDLATNPIASPVARLSIKQGWGNWLGLHLDGAGGQDAGHWGLHNPQEQDRLMFYFKPPSLDPLYMFTLHSNGKVGIGTVPPANGSIYKLYVADGIATRDVKVTAGNWPDFVFADDYRLMPLSELRAFLKRDRHLPGIPSAAEVERNEGVEVGDIQVRLLKAVEEQALYILHLEERIKALEERNN